MKKNIAVIGAGITGLMSAYYLAKDGHNVTVYEEEKYAAMKTSFANGGQVSVSNSETWNSWSNIIKGIKWVFSKDAPLLIRPKIDLAMWSWMLKFVWTTIKNEGQNNTEKTIQLGIESRKLYDQLCLEECIEFDRLNTGILHFYKDETYWKTAQASTALYNANGLDRTIIDKDLSAKDPALGNIRSVVGATFTPSDWTGDIHKFCYNLVEILETKYLVKFIFNIKITNLERLSDLYDGVVVSNGVGSAKLARSVGDKLDVYPVKGYSITINNVPEHYLPKVSLLDDQSKIVTSALGNRFRVAGTAELTGENYDITRSRIEPLLKWVHTNFPNINTHDYTQWACLRPMTPNMMPIIKQSKNNKKIFYHTGHGHLGWTLSPATAKQLSELIKK